MNITMSLPKISDFCEKSFITKMIVIKFYNLKNSSQYYNQKARETKIHKISKDNNKYFQVNAFTAPLPYYCPLFSI